MIKITYLLIAAALAALIAGPASAQSIQYLGPHTTDTNQFVDGSQGVLNYNDLCSAAFDGSQMCESIDILRSGSPVQSPFDPFGQWVKPTLITAFWDGTDVNYVDASGIKTTTRGGLSCLGWSIDAGAFLGLRMSAFGQFSTNACSEILAVACCKVTSGKK